MSVEYKTSDFEILFFKYNKKHCKLYFKIISLL